MQTSQIITLLKRTFNDWSREDILSLVDEVQKMVFSQRPTNEMRIVDTTTGKDPILSTVAGTYSYDLTEANGMPSDFWRATSIYVLDPTEQTPALFFDGKSGVACKIVFKDDPGTGSYYVKGYRYPTELTAETIQLEVPEAYHMTYIFEGVAGIIEQLRTGRSDRYINFETKLLPKLASKMSENSYDNYTPYRGY